MDTTRKAFVIMPFEAEFDSIFNQLIKPALEEAGYLVTRADSFLNQQNILRDIIHGISGADLIVAELTSQNPNVLYELGLCHGLRIPTILLAQIIDDIPFDLRTYRILLYSTRFDQIGKLKQDLKDIGEGYNRGEITFGSPVIDFFIASNKAGEANQSAAQVIESIDRSGEMIEVGKKGFLDFIVEGGQALAEQYRLMSLITQEIRTNTERMTNHYANLEALKGKKELGTTIQARDIAAQIARDLLNFAGKINDFNLDLKKNIADAEENISAYIKWVDLTKEEPQEALNLLEATKGLLSAVRGTKINTLKMHDAYIPLGTISREMNIAVNKTSIVINQLITVYELQEAFCVKTIGLLNDKLSNQSRDTK